MRSKAETRTLMDKLLNPKTVGDLRDALIDADRDIPVFSFEAGDLRGRYSWKRKLTYKQWCREEKKRLLKSAQK